MKSKLSTSTQNQTVIGILEWFRPGEYEEVNQAVKDLNELGIKHLRTGISWADWHLEGTEKWYDWLFKTLSEHVSILPCFHYTPPELGEKPKVSSPPKNPKDYADFIDVMIDKYGKYFEWVELWNEPNNLIDYDFTLDYSWNKFAEMIKMAAYWAQQKGKKTLLGGMSPIDPNWLMMMIEKGALENIDAVGIHGFPDVYDQQWESWTKEVNEIKSVLEHYQLNQQIWISEVGFSTWNFDEVRQYQEFKNAIEAEVDRVYWYSLKDLHPKFATTGGFHLDERDYHFGLKTINGKKKLLYKLLENKRINPYAEVSFLQKSYEIPVDEEYILITGGAGFVGTNVADRLMKMGNKVMIYDSLLRDGVIENLQWLKENHPDQLLIQIADIREKHLLNLCVKQASAVFHFAAQVAVTTSVTDPLDDYQINLSGTLNLLEAIRHAAHQPPVFFTSTNKVYGNLREMEFEINESRYESTDANIQKNGISELQNLDFHSPYGCSKGAADQYILDYSKTYGLKSLVFRMSCIYGTHQFGNEDQGWVAHFLISTLKSKGINIYGNGKQVRDILFVEDLVDAFLLALKNIDQLQGQAFNIGGGPKNAVSLLELLQKIEKLTDLHPQLTFSYWRVGDQYYYVSDTDKFSKATGWKPKYSVDKGLKKLYEWLLQNRPAFSEKNLSEKPKEIAI